MTGLTIRDRKGMGIQSALDPFLGISPWIGHREHLPNGRFMPKFDVVEGGGEYVVRADMPGVRGDDIDISVADNKITVSGARSLDKPEEDGGYHIRERTHGSFSRTFKLPNNIDAGSIEASLESGELIIRVPKSADAMPRKIPISQGDDT